MSTTKSTGDTRLRFVLADAGVRGAVVRLDAAWQDVLASHSYPPHVLEVLGHAIGATSVLSTLIKLDGAMILQTEGTGDLHTLVAHATSERTIRGLARYHPGLRAGDFSTMCGDGKLVVTMDTGRDERYQGIVLLEGENLARVLEGYFSQSEQLRTRLWLQADESTCAALMLQELGDSDVDDQDAWTRVNALANTLGDDELLGVTPKAVLRRLFHEETVSVFEPEAITFRCGCSMERIAAVLRSLGSDEVEGILEEKGRIDVDCEFCNRHFVFEAFEARALFVDDQLPDQLH